MQQTATLESCYITWIKVGQEAAVDNLAAKLLETLWYDNAASDAADAIVFTRRGLPLVICGENRKAQTDLCIVNDDEIILLVQEDKNITSVKNPQPQVIAEAIAAFGENAWMRQIHHLPPTKSTIFPAITMTGSTLTFYKIPVTDELSSAVRDGVYPATQTRVLQFAPVLPRQDIAGMIHLDNRREILACLAAFKKFMAT
ncbi:hypothetical protein HD554DRAFT_1026621 [Boletus coccyginus]|nr:hypothetical protein HD554DRAFT_1026621 [Boletus coccyginus]